MAEGMDQDQARLLFDEGATLVFLDVPVGTEFGIDYNSWQVGPKFKGVKMIPPGIHFIYYSATNKEKGVAPRTGFFYNFRQKEVLVKRWDQITEDIKIETITDEELERFTGNKQELDRYLGAYPYESFKKWVSLTSHITPALLNKLQPLTGRICSATEFISESSNTAQRKAAAATCEGEGQMEVEGQDMENKTLEEKEAMLPCMKSVPGTEMRLTEIPKQKYPPGATPEEITKYSMDYSYALETMLSHYDEKEDILGELQFAFICFIIGQVYDGFEHWKLLVNLLCNCCEALTAYSSIYKQFVTVLHFQLKEVPEDFFVDIVSQNNFLTLTLHSFFENLEISDVDGSLKIRGQKFQDYLTKTYKWDFTTEPEDYSPVIIEESC